jgi:hypothetical protein
VKREVIMEVEYQQVNINLEVEDVRAVDQMMRIDGFGPNSRSA